MNKLFLTWQDKKSRKWFPIGQLTYDGVIYRFCYLKGAQVAKEESVFQPLVSFPDLREIYDSSELFPMFANRVLPASRPEYHQIIEWLSLAESKNDPIAFLARTGGAKVTDTFEIFRYPQLEDEKYVLHFFAHGLRHLPECSIERVNQMKEDDRIFLAHDFQNPFDSNALQLHTRDNFIVGYCPSYLLDDVNAFVRKEKEFEVCVERINDQSAPLQFRLLCRLIVPKMPGYKPFTSEMYKPITTGMGKTMDDVDMSFA